MPTRVYLVDDQRSAQELLADHIAGMPGMAVVATASGEGEAKLWLEEHPQAWDLMVVDLILSDGSGFGVIRRAKDLNPDAQVVVFSGFASEGVKAHCIQLGADAVIDKAEPAKLMDWLEAFAARA